MKKAMITLMCIISVLISFAFAMYSRSNDNRYLDSIEQNNHASTFYIRNSQAGQEDQLKLLHFLSEKYHATFIRNDKLINDETKEISYKSGIFYDGYLKNAKLDLIKGKISTSKNKFIATYNTKNQHQTGQIRDLFADNPLIIQSLENFYNQHPQDVNGIYTLIVSKKYKDNIITELAAGMGVSKKSLLTKNMEKGYGEGTLYLLALILCAVIFLIFCLMNVFYPMARLKEIGVRKLQGYGNFAIWGSLNAHSIIIPIICFLISIIPQLFIIKNSGIQYFVTLGMIQLSFFLICILFSLLMLLVIRKFSIANMIKGYFNSKISLYFSYTLKFLIITALIAIIPLITKEFSTFKSQLNARATYQTESKYLTLSKYQFAGNDKQDFLTGGKGLEKKLIKMQLELERTAKSEFVRTTLYRGNQLRQFSDNKVAFKPRAKYYIMQINENYLKRLNIIKAKNIHKLFTSKKITFLVPDIYKNQKKQIQFIAHDQANDLLPESQQLENIYDSPAQIIYYPSKLKPIFSENMDLIDINGGFVSNPILICVGKNYFTPGRTYLTDGAASNPIRILNTKVNKKAIDLAIKNADLLPNRLKFDNVLNTGFKNEFDISKTSLLAWIVITTMVLFVSILASYYIILIILISRRKEMLVSRLLGYPMLTRYKNECLYFLAIYIFGFGELFFLSTNFYAILLYSLAILIDGLVIFFMAQHHEQKSLALLLKGEE